jgi:2',3'-cyclic-nucleotide 2'-phosphodiesterase (5'-nucleotidase family)
MKKKLTIQILQTSDIHGYVYPFNYSTKKEEKGGLAKLSTMIKQLRNENTILIDTGDTIQGSPMTYYHAKNQPHTVNPMAKVFNHMKYDYVSIGNHEFNYGKNYLNNYLDNLDAIILNANIIDQTTNQPYRGVSHHIKTLENGLRIGLIGVTTHYIPNWEQQSHIEDITFLDAFQSAKEMVQKLRDKVDYLIVNYHGGFEKDLQTFKPVTEDTGENQGSKMLENIDGIDLLLTGHQHRELANSVNNTTYTQPGCNARLLSKIILDFEYENQWSVVNTSSALLEVSNQIADQQILDLLSELEQQTQVYLDTPVGFLDQDLLITDQLQARLQKHPIVSFINQIQLDFTQADISICSLGNQVSGFQKEITIRDIIGTYIYPNTLVVKELSGETLRLAIEKTAGFFDIEEEQIIFSKEYNYPKLQLYAYDMYDGIDYTLDISKPKGERIIKLLYKGKEITPKQKFKVVMNNYRSSGGGDYTFIKDAPIIIDTQKEVIELMIDYILKHKQIHIQHKNNIKIVK